jgi:hypothetical protein
MERGGILMRKWIVAALVVVLALALGVPSLALANGNQSVRVAAKAKGRPTFVSHPYTKRDVVVAGTDFGVWGYVNTWHSVPLSTSDSTLTIQVQKWNGGHSWEATSGLNTTGTLTAKGAFKRKLNYGATMNIGLSGLYRLTAVLVWRDAKGVERTTWSCWKYLWIK